MGVALAVVGWLGVGIVFLRLVVVVLGILPTTVVLGVALAVFRVVVAPLARNVVSRVLYQCENARNAAQDRHGSLLLSGLRRAQALSGSPRRHPTFADARR